MPTQEQKQWIADLRSGEFEQTQGCLEDDHGFCCLGVATQRLAPELRNTTQADVIRYGNESFFLPQVVADALGMINIQAGFTGEYPLDDGESSYYAGLVEMNDDGVTFEQIADFIEANPHLVFKNVAPIARNAT